MVGDRRRGQISDLMIVAITFVILAEVAGVAILGGMIAENTVSKTGEVYVENVAGVDVLEPSCATVSRGVFYRSAIESESFSCLNPPEPVSFKFKLPSRTYEWDISAEEGKIDSPSYMKTYNILIYDRKQDEILNGTLRVGR